MSSADEFHEVPPQKRGMSSTAKVLLVLGSIAGLMLLACCGGGIFLWHKAGDAIKQIANNFSVTQNPVEVRERTQEMLHIDIPEDFTPRQAMNLMVMRMAIYEGKSGPNSMLMIMAMDRQMIDPNGQLDAKQQRDQMIAQMRQQQSQQMGTFDEVVEESHETKTFTIDGKPVEFDFVKGRSKSTQAVVRQVIGVITTNEGIVLVRLMVPEADYNEEAIVAMIQSIHAPDESGDEDEMESGSAEKTPEGGAGQPAGNQPDEPKDVPTKSTDTGDDQSDKPETEPGSP